MLWYLSDRARFVQPLVLRLMGRVPLGAGAIRSMLLSGAYLAAGLAGAAAVAGLAGLPAGAWLGLRPDDAGLILLGVVAEVSLCNLLVSLYVVAVGPGRVPFAEIAEIPWMEGIRAASPAVAPLLGAAAAAVEEMFFRGAVLLVLWERSNAAVAIVLAGVLFWLQQVVQVRTRFQAVVISAGCLSISLVGGLLVVASGSVVPAVICHAAFVIFFFRRDGSRAGRDPRARPDRKDPSSPRRGSVRC